MKKIVFLISISIFALFLIQGCSTIVNGTTQDISINSNPQKANVKVMDLGGNTIYTGSTPSTVKLSRKNAYKVELALDGYEKATIMINKGFEPMVIGNLICGQIPGLLIDFISGAANKLEPNQINFSLAVAMNEFGEEETFAVFNTLDENNELRTMSLPLIKK